MSVNSVMIRLFLLSFFMGMGGACEKSSNGSNVSKCLKDNGCLNERLHASFYEKCRDRRESCRLSFDELVGIKPDNVYFVNIAAADLRNCKDMTIPSAFFQTYTEGCEYVLFEKEGSIVGHVRGMCLSEWKIKPDIVFEAPDVVVGKLRDPHDKMLMNSDPDLIRILPQAEQLIPYRETRCVGY